MFGTAGLVLGILNYLRDRPNVAVTLQWDMSVTENPVIDPRKKWGVISVTSVGRRPVYIVSVALELPKCLSQNACTAVGDDRTREVK